ncbi:class I SAM-dependent DNA methyltransferase [Intestinibacter bartlettii]|uniref:class I SAM-dependent DNA methyltransferase n=1 Tax=Intestinibacter bartlettii TaxID=261299 RepID=UPI0034ABB59F
MSLGSLIKKIQDIMRGDAGVGGDEQRLSQIVWILFLKIFDYKEEEWKYTKDDYESIIPEGYRWRDWVTSTSLKEQMTGEELIDFVNNKLFRVLSGDLIKDENGEDILLFKSTKKSALIVKEIMRESNNFMKNGVLLRKLVNEFDQIDFSDIDERHTFNDIYEQLLKGLQKSNGEFYTNRAITSFVVDKVNPVIGETIADFACGTGGFLVDALKYIEENNKLNSEDYLKLQNSFYGVEKKQLPYMLCTTNMLLHDIEIPNIMHDNSLEHDVRKYTDEDKFDVILMNPPYGGSELEIVQKNFPAELRNSETADLFIIEIMYRLKKNGRCGVVLPDGFLFNTDNSKKSIKKKLLEEFNLHTVIRLPQSCFAPYTNIATNLLFFDKIQPTKETWFYRYDLPNGQKFSMTKNPMTREKMLEIDEWWDNRIEVKDEKEDKSMTETWKSKKVFIQEIIENNYSLDYCGYPNQEKIILSPEETINNFKKERERLDKLMDEKLQEILNLLGVQ